MADIAPTVVAVDQQFSTHVRVVTWAGLSAANNTGTAVEMPGFGARSVQVTGTIGVLDSVGIEGSNDGVNYAILTDEQGNDLKFDGLGISDVAVLTRYIRPRVLSGAPAATVVLLLRKTDGP